MHRIISLFVVATICSVSCFAEEISGIYFREKGLNFLFHPKKNKRFLLITSTEESTQAVSQLQSADLVYGTGEIAGDTFFMNSVDVVGLRQLLGKWISLHTQLDFLNFNSVTVRQHVKLAPQQPILKTLQYVVTPGPEKFEWRVFFSDDKSVTLASLALSGRIAQFDFYDENTGEVINRIVLKKQ
jgi:hypothetical protein